MCRLLKVMLAMVGRDVLQLARVSPKMKQEVFLPNFARPSISLITPSLFWLSMQRLAQDATELVELWELVTQTSAAAIMAEARAAWAKKMAQERVFLVATARGEVDEAAQRVSVLEGELAVVHQALDITEKKLPSLAAKATTAIQWQVAAKE
jgi:hypothetical protein